MERPQAQLLSGGRLHLSHGPIDLIVQAWGPAREAALSVARQRFQTILTEIVGDLGLLRSRPRSQAPFSGPARAMVAAVRPFSDCFVTPMAAVAGAVADTICAEMIRPGLTRIYVNNGGDVALWCAPGERLAAAIPGVGRAHVAGDDPVRGIATSGWRGRSHSLGIADSVTILAKDAATADVAATLIANAVDLPDHPGIRRAPATTLSPDSDLGERAVTVGVPLLSEEDVERALKRGRVRARDYLQRGLIHAALLSLQGHQLHAGVKPKERTDA